MAIYQGHNEDSSGNLLLSIGNGMTATVETGSTASQAYTKGSYLFFNNRLCKAASAIASGATLTIGGNLTQTSLGAEITSHLRSSDGKEFYFDVKDGTYGYYPSASKTSSEFVPFGGTGDNVLAIYQFTSGSYNRSTLGLIKLDCSEMEVNGLITVGNVVVDGITLYCSGYIGNPYTRIEFSSTRAATLYTLINGVKTAVKTWTAGDTSKYTQNISDIAAHYFVIE